jgi:hypothetical protein
MFPLATGCFIKAYEKNIDRILFDDFGSISQ